MSQVVKVFGVPDCLAAFADLPRTIQNKHMRVALNAAGGVIRDAAAANVPKESGLLKKSLKVKVKVPSASYNKAHHGRPAYAVVGPARRTAAYVSNVTGKTRTLSEKRYQKAKTLGFRMTLRRPARYAHLLERGTKAHTITAKGRLLSNDSAVFGKTVRHPGTKGTGFLSRAVASHGQSALKKMGNKLADAVLKWAARRGSQLAKQLVEA